MAQRIERPIWVIVYRTLKGKSKGNVSLTGVTGSNRADAKENFKLQTDFTFEQQQEMCQKRGENEILCLRGTLTVNV